MQRGLTTLRHIAGAVLLPAGLIVIGLLVRRRAHGHEPLRTRRSENVGLTSIGRRGNR